MPMPFAQRARARSPRSARVNKSTASWNDMSEFCELFKVCARGVRRSGGFQDMVPFERWDTHECEFVWLRAVWLRALWFGVVAVP